jgi:outer membrane protein assembly factor BamB
MKWRLALGCLPAALLLAVACSRPVPTQAEAAPDAPAARPQAAKQAAGPDWPMFGGTPRRNMVDLAAKGLPVTWSVKKGKEVNVKWVARLGGHAYGGPVVAGGKVFVGTNNHHPRDPKVTGDKGVLMCFNAADGKFLWQAVHDKLPDPGLNDFAEQGVISTPAVEGDRVYYVSNRAEVVCADVEGDPATGKAKILWTYDMIGELKVFPCQASACSPLVVGDLVFVVTGNGVDAQTGKLPAPDAPSFLAVHKKTGKLAWKSSLPGKNVMRGQWSNPAAAEVNGKTHVVFPGGDGWLYGLEAKTGELLWKFDLNPKKAKPYKFTAPGSERCFPVATPVVYDNKVYIGVGQEPDDGQGVGHLWCIDITKEPKNKDKDLSPVGDNFDPKAAVNKDSGLVWHYGGMLVPKPADAERDWVFGRTMSSVAVHDGLVYAPELAGFLHCLDAKTGKQVWEFDMRDGTWCSPLVADGRLFVGTDGDLLIFPAGKGVKEPAKINMEASIKVPPVIVSGVIYINTGAKLYAIGPK